MTSAIVDTRSLVRRRLDALAVLNPLGSIPSPRVELAVDLALRFSCHVKPVRFGDDGVRACRSTRHVWTGPIVDDAALAEFCHEVGHVTDPVGERPSLPMGQHCAVSIFGEVEAWKFAARILARRWTRAMHLHAESCLKRYRQGGHYIQHPDERTAMDDFIAASFEQSRHVVRAFPVRR